MTFEQFENIETTEDEQLIALVATHFQVNPTKIHWNGAEGLELIKYYRAIVEYNSQLVQKNKEQLEALRNIDNEI